MKGDGDQDPVYLEASAVRPPDPATDSGTDEPDQNQVFT
jgi:hypothetical protein